ncbi:hypothetical protein [Argonema antarcticum]|uniref:hypothetical protein n=1 Tax=Argonema antarcticum TaxID=2942763 RepID=UPI002012B538|nr:hypothetical protein [Argonema antarcticum]MCL1473914.1 hypothetical protein [Argonema antarcticum A004/B2]
MLGNTLGDVPRGSLTTSVYLMLYPKPALAKVLLDNSELLKQVWQAIDCLRGGMKAIAFLMRR